jgi:hypothetical protein
MQSNNSLFGIVIFLTLALTVAFGVKTHNKDVRPTAPPVVQAPPVQPLPQPEPPKTPRIPNISTAMPAYLDYPGIAQQCQKWAQEAPDLAEYGTYGKTKRGTDICYLRVCNKLDAKPRPKVLLTGCIHGNEPWATVEMMAYCGTLLGEYGKNKEITDLVESRDIYFVPVISPDSYPHSRYVDGVDPNRDFPGPSRPSHQSTPSIAAIQQFFLKIKPNAAISGHTHGRIFLTPFGDKMQVCPNDADYKRIVGKMASMANYRMDRACNMYNRPIHGSEVDWYYRNGAFAIVMELGTHQQRPSVNDIQSEYNRTWAAVKLFIQEAPLVRVGSAEALDASENTGISHRYFRFQRGGLVLLDPY